jgi:hypothetical protein
LVIECAIENIGVDCFEARPGAAALDTEEHLQLVVVKRDEFATFELLGRVFADGTDVRVVWDRRVRQRRQASSQRETERRASDRRRLTKSWTHLNYLVVHTAA